MVKLNLKDAYLTVPIHSEHKQFLRFTCQGKHFQFKTLPFGLAKAPRVFTKLLMPVASTLRASGIRLIVYIDDTLIMGSSPTKASENVQMAIQLLESLGIIINWKKSVLVPSQTMEFLGLQVDSTSLPLSVPDNKY